MPTYRLTFNTRRPQELVEADGMRETSTAVELLRDTAVMGRPRTVVARRVSRAEIHTCQLADQP